jgi:hypothetical protein
MKKIMLAALMLLPFSVMADHLDVIKTELKDGCTLNQYLEIMKDFNEQWGKNNAYHGEVLTPIQSDDLTSVYWIGRSSGAQSFGKAWDTWRDEAADPNSVAGKLQARFADCSVDQTRRSYDIH